MRHSASPRHGFPSLTSCAALYAAIFLLIANAPAFSQSLWHVTDSNFNTQEMNLQFIDDSAVHGLNASAEDVSLPVEHFLEAVRELPAKHDNALFSLYFRNGDHLPGEPIVIDGNDLRWSSPILGDLKFPLQSLAAIAGVGAVPPTAAPAEDQVTLANNDIVHGIVTGLANGNVNVQSNSGNIAAIPISSLRLISFAASAGKHPVKRAFRITLDDQSALTVSSLSLSAGAVKLSLPGGAVQPVPLERVEKIEQLNGPITWLSSVTPVENVYTPLIAPGLPWPARMDRSVTGEPIRFGNTTFAHGIGVHAYSRLTWEIAPQWVALRTRYAIDGDDTGLADVTVRILLDGKSVYEQPHVHAGELSPIIMQTLSGAKTLTLEADFGDRLDTRARLNWIEPAFLTEMPTPTVGETSTTLPTTSPTPSVK